MQLGRKRAETGTRSRNAVTEIMGNESGLKGLNDNWLAAPPVICARLRGWAGLIVARPSAVLSLAVEPVAEGPALYPSPLAPLTQRV